MKNLIIGNQCKLTTRIERTLNLLDSYFDGLPTTVTSGLRDKKDQLRIIDELVEKEKISKMFCEYEMMKDNDADMQTKINGSGLLYWWERTYLELLKKGYLVNPPCKVFYKEQKRWIEPSPHFKGTAFDLGGKDDLETRVKKIVVAKHDGNCFIKSFKIERSQNCIHVDCETIV